jgi:hypothetical protein
MLLEMNFAPLLGYGNTYPFTTLIYAELGIAGMVIVPIIHGLMVRAIYKRFVMAPTAANLFVYINVPSVWLWLFSWPGLTVLTFYLKMLFVWGFYVAARTLVSQPAVRTRIAGQNDAWRSRRAVVRSQDQMR